MTSGSNWLPARRVSSARASVSLMPGAYGREAIMAW